MTKAEKLSQAWRDLPCCVEVDEPGTPTLSDLRFWCRFQLDLCEEGQDGTEDDDQPAMRRWLKKYPAATKAART